MSYQQWTFLAPTDKAWKAVPKATMDALKKDTKAYAELVYLHFMPIGVRTYDRLSRDSTKKNVRAQICSADFRGKGDWQ